MQEVVAAAAPRPAPRTTARRLLLLHRAARNAGDHLIFERARRLIAIAQPGAEIDVADASRPLAGQIPEQRLSNYDAIIIAGGPGYTRGIVRTYPIGRLDRLPPLVPLALGSYVLPGTSRQLASYRFTRWDRAFLDAILERVPYLGARDPVTERLLQNNGYQRVLMTGDPAWYDLDRIDTQPIIPQKLRAVAFTPPSNPAYYRQAVRLFDAFARQWPGAAIRVVHHRGLQRPFAKLADARKWINHEISGSLDGFSTYDEVDLHVGYRVHAHLYATSRGVPSYLVAEDSRGLGMIEGLGGIGIAGFSDGAGTMLGIAMRLLPRLANPTRSMTWRLGPRVGTIPGILDIAGVLVERIHSDEQAGFPEHRVARQRIQSTLPVMQRMIASIP